MYGGGYADDIVRKDLIKNLDRIAKSLESISESLKILTNSDKKENGDDT